MKKKEANEALANKMKSALHKFLKQSKLENGNMATSSETAKQILLSALYSEKLFFFFFNTSLKSEMKSQKSLLVDPKLVTLTAIIFKSFVWSAKDQSLPYIWYPKSRAPHSHLDFLPCFQFDLI